MPLGRCPVRVLGDDAVTAYAPGGALVSNIEVTATTVQRGDIIQLGGAMPSG